MDGIELALRFSYMPNKLRFCGPKEAQEIFTNYLKEKDNETSVASNIKRFEGLYPYLSAIASKSGKKFTDYDVVEAYWIGNKLLDKFSDKDLKSTLLSLVKGGLPRSIAESRARNLPSGLVPHHNFNVFFVGVGQITGSVPTTIENMNSCMVSQGTVLKINKNKLIVSRQHLLLKKNKFVFGKEKDVEVKYLSLMLRNVKKNDIVAMHWGFAPLVLTEKQSKNLMHYTEKIINVLNKSRAHNKVG